jgi:hypothetical protein
MMTLDDLAGNWLKPENEWDFSQPAITNFTGTVQAAWDVAGIQYWIHPPTGLGTPTVSLYIKEDGRIRRFSRKVEYRWKAYEIERRCDGVTTVTRLAENKPIVMQKMSFDRDMTICLAFNGLPRVWRFTDYWNLPPENEPMFNVVSMADGFLIDDTKTFGAVEFHVPGKLTVYHDLSAWLDGDYPIERGKIGIAEIEVKAGNEITWWAVQGCEEAMVPFGEFDEEWEKGKTHWERVWKNTFTPNNPDFSGYLPYQDGELERLFCMGVITLLNGRRLTPAATPRSGIATGGQCIWVENYNPLPISYVWGAPEGAPTTSFLWEVSYQAPLLARLDPAVLKAQLEAMIAVDLHDHWGLETVSGRGAGMYYGVNHGAFFQCVEAYVKHTGDKAWALSHLEYLKSHVRPNLTDYGDFQNVLECVSTYEHVIASYNAMNVQGMRFMAELTGDPTYSQQADALSAQILALYEGGPFACLQPDGERRICGTILDFNYVGLCMTPDIPQNMREGMVRYFESELQTEDWLYALSPKDPDAYTKRLPSFQTYRADHQATGAFDAWPAYAASVLLRFGLKDKAMPWLKRIEELTYEGPFGQAHYVFPDGARKASFYNGNCYMEAGGCTFATMVLDEM